MSCIQPTRAAKGTPPVYSELVAFSSRFFLFGGIPFSAWINPSAALSRWTVPLGPITVLDMSEKGTGTNIHFATWKGPLDPPVRSTRGDRAAGVGKDRV